MALKDKLMTLEDFKAVRDVDVASNSAQFTEIKADLGASVSYNEQTKHIYNQAVARENIGAERNLGVEYVEDDNLLDSVTITEGKSVWASDGRERTQEGYCASDYIDIHSYDSIVLTGLSKPAVYDENKTHIPNAGPDASNNNPVEYDVPSNVYYMRATAKIDYISACSIRPKDGGTFKIPKLVVEGSQIVNNTSSIESDVKTLKIKAKDLDYTRVNLYDITTVKDDIAIWMDGAEHSTPNSCCSDFIDISTYKNLKIFGTTLICFYTGTKNLISANNTEGDTRFTERLFEVPVNAVYIRISTRATYKSSVYIGDGLVNFTNVKEKHISILFVGNSLTHDSVSYVPYILSTLFPEIDFSIHIFYNGGTTLASQYNRFVNDTPCANYSMCENAYTWKTRWNERTMAQVLETYKFDVVCMQDYFTFRDSFTESDLAGWNNCQSYIAAHYTGGNPLKFITLMPAPVRDNWTSQTHPTTAVVYAATVTAMKLIMKNTIADAVIPCGMGIYKAMDTSLDDMGDTGHLAQDALHCQEGVPCLLQAYIITLWILKELGLPKSIYASPIRITTEIYETLNVPGNNVGTGVITGTDAQNLLAQEIAIQAHKEVSRWDYDTAN